MNKPLLTKAQHDSLTIEYEAAIELLEAQDKIFSEMIKLRYAAMEGTYDKVMDDSINVAVGKWDELSRESREVLAEMEERLAMPILEE